jgi:hypothetical protein
MKAKKPKKAAPKKTDKYDITVKLSGKPDEGLKKLMGNKKVAKK